MTRADPTLGGRLHDLALALLNATLMLAVLLVFGVWLLLGRMQDFTAETVGAVAENVSGDLRTRLDTQTNLVAGTLERFNALEDRLTDTAERLTSTSADADQAAAAELAGLRAELQSLNESLNAEETGSTGVAAASTANPDVIQTQARLSALETQIKNALDESKTKANTIDSKAASEVNALREDVQRLTATLQDTQSGLAALRQETSGSLRGALHQLLLDLAGRMAPSPPSSPPSLTTTEG
ncbi:MAG: hypothetical protein AAF922_00855 [Pseudomonadota bacterium]